MFVIGKDSHFGDEIYLMNYRRVNDGVTPSIASAHKYKTQMGAERSAKRANELDDALNNWHPVEIVQEGNISIWRRKEKWTEDSQWSYVWSN